MQSKGVLESGCGCVVALARIAEQRVGGRKEQEEVQFFARERISQYGHTSGFRRQDLTEGRLVHTVNTTVLQNDCGVNSTVNAAPELLRFGNGSGHCGEIGNVAATIYYGRTLSFEIFNGSTFR